MKTKLSQLREEALKSLSAVEEMDILENLRVQYMGKKGELTNILKEMGKLPEDWKKPTDIKIEA